MVGSYNLHFLLLFCLLDIGHAQLQSFAGISQNFCANNADQSDDNLSCPNVATEGVACLPRTALCNGVNDCEDGADEGEPALMASLNCSTSQFDCGNGVWISINKLCDGIDNCVNGSRSGSDETLLICDNKCIGPYYGGCDHTRECLNARDSVNCSACLPGQNLVSIQGETSCATVFIHSPTFTEGATTPEVQACVTLQPPVRSLPYTFDSFQLTLDFIPGPSASTSDYNVSQDALTLVFTSAALTQCVPFSIVDDSLTENAESFTVVNSRSGAIGFVTIQDDDHLLPFGENFGDQVLPKADDSSSDLLDISILCPFFGTLENRIFVNTNGILSFRNSFTSPLQQQTFPLGSGVLIAPFWNNIDILIAGQILYRFSNNITLLEEVGSSINDGSGFSPSLLFIATWDRVAMNDEPNEDMPQINTFQAVIATDGDKTYVLFLYEDIQWASTSSVIGFNAGDGTRFFSLNESLSRVSVLNLEKTSDIGIPGRYIFRVDQDSITTVFDRFPSMHGNLRLLGNNESISSAGRLEIFFSSTWGTICNSTGFDEVAADVACRQMGFQYASRVGTVRELGFTPASNSTPIWLDGLVCHNSDTWLLDCDRAPFVNCSHTLDVALRCTNNADPVRLVSEGGETNGQSAGRLEIFINNEWGTVCDDSFTAPEADVACHQLGFPSGHKSYYPASSSPFNITPAVGPIWLDDLDCSPSDTNLRSCGHAGTGVQNCLHPEDIILSCQEDMPDNSVTGIIGGVVGTVALLIIITFMIIAIVCARKYRKKTLVVSGQDKMDHLLVSQQSTFLMCEACTDEVPKNLVIPSCNLQLGEPVGQGEFGIVYKAKLSKGFNQLFSDTVAVKTLKGFVEESLIKDLVRECAKMSSLDHPNVLTLIGVCLDGGPAPFIVMPFMFNGSLLSHLKKERENLVLPLQQELDSSTTAASQKLMDMALQVAKGMEYLASKRLIHRDLAARNCMIDVNLVIKVADFGLSESLDTRDYFRQDKADAVKLPVKWLAPECLFDGTFSEKSDVWAFGVTCWEIFSGGKMPYSGVNPVDLPMRLESGYRMDRPNNSACNDAMSDVINQCWMAKIEERPAFSGIVASLSHSLGSISGYTLLCNKTDNN